MKDITTKMVDDGCAAYHRATGTGPSRAGIRAAMFYGPTVETRVTGLELTPDERTRLRALAAFLRHGYANTSAADTAELLDRLAES